MIEKQAKKKFAMNFVAIYVLQALMYYVIIIAARARYTLLANDALAWTIAIVALAVSLAGLITCLLCSVKNADALKDAQQGIIVGSCLFFMSTILSFVLFLLY